ncbi:UDP-N-acetylmuramate--L-alanine ligase [Romeria aff. gracilis LEGE 07310]|uniref:UDP-N-acetylmuramate--L-alanine ligase n=1 Tax=Vasconcelosia minhoensis LEGE 07310 TaxID=915328 RepID=A0A8J7AML7_9CYAN|nr:UDP-N-acetylmuramate--L-alanine ligase [Romeria gracilis]MBE9077244.1 UDP-N-acetylmuramate--L-alanine ligase [Romeria aff. gracilis LEGE 07310]
MLNSVDFSGRPFHFIGIGGIGMSALAYVLAQQNLPVSGSDLRLSHITQRLEAQGVHIFWSQVAENLSFWTQGLPQVVCSTAIGQSNAEYQAAVELGCPIFHRSDILAALMEQHQGIAVAGTHGKTTTSSMIGYLLLKAGLDPTIVIGGEVSAWEGNAHVGESRYMVAEADESDGSLAKLTAQIGVVTNIELDHPDHYSSLDEVVGIFTAFSGQCQVVVGNLDCPTVRDRLRPTVSYGLGTGSDADYVADNIRKSAQGMTADVWERGKRLGRLDLPLLGQHNLSNAMAAIAVGRLLGIDFSQIATILRQFQGARRRFERRGYHSDILFIDDYAHHPSEIRATLAAAQQQSSEPLRSGQSRRVVAVFQPHRYSRSAALLDEFATAFDDADQVIVTDIYAAGEVNCHQISGEQVRDAIALHHSQTEYQASLEAVKQRLSSGLRAGDIAIFLTAGNLNQVIPEVMSGFQQSASSPQEALIN